MQKTSQVQGQITAGDSRRPVHGLRVQARSIHAGNVPVLASGITTADGVFRLHWSSDRKAETRIELLITDRDGQLVATRRINASARDQANHRLEVGLTDKALANHLARPTTWTDTGRRLFPRQLESEISQAIGLLAPVGSSRFDELFGHILCPGPMLPAVDDLIDTGWEVLTGDPSPLERFRDTIQTLQAVDARYGGVASSESTESWMKLVSDEGIAGLRALKRDPVTAPAAFGPDILVPLLLPASMVSSGRREVLAPYVGLVLRQLDTARRVGALHTAAQRAMGGDPQALRHFENMLDMFGALCGPDDGPMIFPDENFRPFDHVVDPHCLADLVDHALHGVLLYAIYSIEPARACADNLVTISGYGFDSVAQQVRFGRWGAPNSWITVTPESWSNEQITVRVPPDAGCGLRLAMPPQASPACGRYVDAWPAGSIAANFTGGAAQILNFAINGNTDTFTVLPGDTLEFTWRTCAADDIHLELVVVEDGSVPYELQHGDVEGTWEQTLWHCNATTELKARITATGSCPPLQTSREITVYIHHLPILSVHGIEVTQAIQYYRADEHLTDSDDQGGDNTVQLIAGKTGYVRVYLRSGLDDQTFDDGVLRDVLGTLTVSRIVDGDAELVDVLSSLNGPVDARWGFDDYADERRNLDASLNFLIPAAEMHGLLRLRAYVDVSDPAEAPCGGGSAEHTIEVNVDLDQTLKLVAIPVAYEGPPFDDPDSDEIVTIDAPEEEELVNRLDYALKLFPVNENPNIRTTEPITIDYPLDGDRAGDGGCSYAWSRFLAFDLLPAKLADGNEADAVYLGLVSKDLPKNPNGCAQFGVTGVTVTKRTTIAHEIGHVLGRPHAPRGNVGDFDTEFPAYEPYDEDDTPNGSIGEYGLDFVKEEVHAPDTADLMSYGSNRWISLHNYKKLIQPGNWLNPTDVPAGSQGDAHGDRDEPAAMEPCIALTALIDDSGSLEVGHVSRMTTRRQLAGRRSKYVVELIDRHGTVITASALHSFNPIGCTRGCACGCAECTGHGNAGGEKSAGENGATTGGGLVTALALLPDRAAGAAIRVRLGGKTVWERKAPARRPRIRIKKAEVSSRGRLRLDWESECDENTTSNVVLRWSRNRRDWSLLAPSLRGRHASLDIRRLPPGRVYFELLLQDGFYTARAASKALTVPEGSPLVGIFHPSADEPVAAGGPLRLWARAHGAAGNWLPDGRIVWYLDGKRVGTGRSFRIKAPKAGRHELRCSASEGRRRSTCKVEFVTR